MLALARRRVALGFVAASFALILADPNWRTWSVGLMIAAAGESFRMWAAGHLEKGREVTQSGPYRITRHPLYVGSAVLALGVVIASRSWIVALITIIYLGATFTAAIRTEEAHLRRIFGDAYDRYRRAENAPVERRFSLARVRRNREHRALVGLVAGFGILALKILLSI